MNNILSKILIMSLVAKHSKMDDLFKLDLRVFFGQYVKDSQQFINNVARDVVQMVGLMKQIQNRQWIYYGESFLSIPAVYNHAKYLFFDSDFAFLSILINYVDQIDYVVQDFFHKNNTYKYFQKGQLYTDKNSKCKNFT